MNESIPGGRVAHLPPPHLNLVERLAWRARNQPDELAMVELRGMRGETDKATYARLDARARAIAFQLKSIGNQGDRVLLVMGNCLDYVVGFLACAYARRVAVNLPVPRRAKHLDRLAHVVADCGAEVLLTSGPEAKELTASVAADLRLDFLTVLRLDWLLAIPDEDWQPVAPASKDVCLLQYTSGSTSAPRGVVVTHDNLMFNCAQIQYGFGLTAEDRALSWLPLYHDMGLILGVLTPIFAGFPVVLADPLSFVKRPDLWLRAISDYRITFTGGPNFAYDLCADAASYADLSGIDLSCWNVALNGAEPIRATTLERFNAALAPLGWAPTCMQPSYGLAENTLAVSTKIPATEPTVVEIDVAALRQSQVCAPRGDSPSRRLVSSGRILAGTMVKIVDPETGHPVGPDRVGEIWLTGRSVAKGYWGRDIQTEEVFAARLPGDPARYLRTGDLGFCRDDELFVVGRLKDLVIVHGANHYPQDLEETAEGAHPAVRSHFVAVFAEEREDREALIVVAEIRREAERGLDPRDVGQRIALAITREHEVSVDAVFLARCGEVPKTTSGKIQRSLCRELLRQGGLALHGALEK
ncbi:fatty acyl-AMP ligase [Mycobacterium marinum]|uniref:fatty acyl-AMP ligase n=1 Tax=Mycobacterium marinum TaxID=1781 RepID=UPI000B972721|nr:fatty acyl-AMP ligase [Mycobacterium marinum]